MIALAARLNEPIGRVSLIKTWAIIGFVLLAAAVLQPIVAGYMSRFTPDELLAPMQMYGGGQPLPPEVKALFSGMFANIQFSLAFSALKLTLGVAILACVHFMRAGAPWAPKALSVFPLLGIGAFAGIGLFFAYSASIIAGSMSIPLFVVASMVLMGLVTAIVPALWLWHNFVSLRAIG